MQRKDRPASPAVEEISGFQGSALTLPLPILFPHKIAVIHPQILLKTLKIEPVYKYCDLHKNRHWEKLFDVFNESFGFFVLSERYNCNNLTFYEQEGKAPDIIGWADGIPHFIEVNPIVS